MTAYASSNFVPRDAIFKGKDKGKGKAYLYSAFQKYRYRIYWTDMKKYRQKYRIPIQTPNTDTDPALIRTNNDPASLQTDLDTLNAWCNTWLVHFNTTGFDWAS